MSCELSIKQRLIFNYPISIVVFAASVVFNFTYSVPATMITENKVLVPDGSDIPALIVYVAKQKGVDPALALNIACAESCMYDESDTLVFNPKAQNPSLMSSASGVFQFIDGSWKAYCDGDVFDAEDNVTCAITLLAKEGGISHWSASKYNGFGGGWANEPYIKTKKTIK